MGNVLGAKEGIRISNTQNRNVAPLITVQDVLRDYLFGIDLKDAAGNPMSEETLQTYLDNGISWLEHRLDIHILPYEVIEEKDYRQNDYMDWGFMYLNEFPVSQFIKMEMVYFRDSSGQPETVQTIPNNWIRFQNHDGIVRLIPNARFPANLQVDQTGSFFPEVLRSNMVPALWRLTYIAGFDDGAVPMTINQAIGLLTAIQAMTMDGISVFGAGVASTSVSFDGLSQSISTTNNAENSAYSQVISQYRKVLFGENEQDPNGLISILQHFYKGSAIGVL